MLSSCGQETLLGGDPNPGGLCSKKRTSLLLNRVAGCLEKPGVAHPAVAVPSWDSCCCPFSVHCLAPLAPQHCSRYPITQFPLPTLPTSACETSQQTPLDPGARSLVGVALCSCCCSLLPRLAPPAPSRTPSSIAPESQAAPHAPGKASAPFPTRGSAGQVPWAGRVLKVQILPPSSKNVTTI